MLLLAIGVLPWSTSLVATYLHQPHGSRLAAMIYGGSLLPYLIATAAGAVSAYVTLVICAAVAIYYSLPGTAYETGGEASTIPAKDRMAGGSE